MKTRDVLVALVLAGFLVGCSTLICLVMPNADGVCPGTGAYDQCAHGHPPEWCRPTPTPSSMCVLATDCNCRECLVEGCPKQDPGTRWRQCPEAK